MQRGLKALKSLKKERKETQRGKYVCQPSVEEYEASLKPRKERAILSCLTEINLLRESQTEFGQKVKPLAFHRSPWLCGEHGQGQGEHGEEEQG